ncbi:MAG: AAA family ATPase, partial [Planctomycetota bacterium]
MYIAEIRIRNYRCFPNMVIEFQPGLNVIIGENNAGKTALLKALGFIFDHSRRSRPDIHDFHQGITDYSLPPDIEISVVLRSSKRDTLDDKAVVATWLTKLESPWEARLTYHFFLPEEHNEEFKKAVGTSPDGERFLNTVETLLP